MTKIKKVYYTKCYQVCGGTETFTGGGDVAQPLWEKFGNFREVNICLPYNPTIPLLSSHSREMRAGGHAKICTQVFIAAVLVIAPKLETTQISINKWIEKQIGVFPYNGLLLINKRN